MSVFSSDRASFSKPARHFPVAAEDCLNFERNGPNRNKIRLEKLVLPLPRRVEEPNLYWTQCLWLQLEAMPEFPRRAGSLSGTSSE